MIIVHNPCDYGMCDYFSGIINTDNINGKTLFREIPDCERFSWEHNEYTKMLANGRNYVIDLIDTLTASQKDTFKAIFESNPNFVYTRDAMITIPWLSGYYILGRMNTSVRKNEPTVWREAAHNLGLSELIAIPDGIYLEGGDIIPFSYQGRRVLLVGYGRRTSVETLYYLRDHLAANNQVDEIIGFDLASWRINLDGGFVPISSELAISHIDSIVGGLYMTKRTEKAINPINYFRSIGYTIIETTKEDSMLRQTCNCFCDGSGTIYVYDFCPNFYEAVKNYGLNVIFVKGEELVKGTGGTRCMTRPIY